MKTHGQAGIVQKRRLKVDGMRMTKHGPAEVVQKRRLMMTRTDAAEVETGVWEVAQV